MKKLKNSMMLLVAITTIGITLMSSKSIKRNKTVETARCFKPNLTVKYRCASPNSTITATSTCTYANDFAGGAHVFSINPNNYIEPAEIPIECFGGDIFCCAQVLTDQTWWGNLEAPCIGQPYFTLQGIYSQFEIGQVYCKD